MTNTEGLLPTLRWLGYGGLLPFAGCSAGVLLVPDSTLRAMALQGLLAYGAVIASFLGGLWWGIALSQPDLPLARRRGLLLAGVVPSLVGCVAVLSGGSKGLLLLGLLLLVLWRADVRWADALSYGSDWRVLRRDLSLVAAVCVLLPLAVLP